MREKPNYYMDCNKADCCIRHCCNHCRSRHYSHTDCNMVDRLIDKCCSRDNYLELMWVKFYQKRVFYTSLSRIKTLITASAHYWSETK